MATTLVDWQTKSTSSPGIQLALTYDWNGSTRGYTIYLGRRCTSTGAWWNTAWSASLTTTYGSNSGTIKPRTSGRIGKNEYWLSASGTVPNDATSVSISGSSGGCTITGTLTVPLGYTAPSQTFVTRITNNTSGSDKNSGDQSNSSTWWGNGNDNTNYAGDSMTFWWDKNSPGNVGVNADPTCRAFLTRDTDNNQDHYDALIYQAWDWTGGGDDAYVTYNYTISAADCNRWLKCMMWKSYLDSGSTRNHYLQGALEYVKPTPTMDAGGSLRSKRFYTGTPSCQVWQVTKMNLVTNGYGMSQIGSNDNSPKYVNNNNVPYKFIMTLSTGGEISGAYRFGPGIFNGNYSLGSTIDVHTVKTSTSGTPSSDAIFYSNWFNPRTGAVDRLGYLSASLGRVSIVPGSIELPTIDSVLPASGNGTTVIVDDTKNIYTNQTHVKITYRVNHSGNKNGFGYDARINEDKGTYKSTSGSGSTLIPIQLDLWSGNYGSIDNSADTFTIQHDYTTTTGSSRSAAIVPYIKDSDGYKIFGAANTTNGLFTSTPYTVYKIDPPKVPTISKWSNTLPAIDGVKDVVEWTAKSPSAWGNVTDFSCGYKMRYKIGKDKTHSDGYEWYFTNTPTTTNTEFSGSFTETYDRSSYTKCTAQMTATSYYSTVWDAYLDFQSAYSTEKSYDIAAKDPYSATTGTLTTPNSTTLLLDVPFTFKCPEENINGNSLIQTTKLIVDGSTEVDLTAPTYSMTDANALTGQHKVTFNDLTGTTPTLARGAHTIQVKDEIVTYFDSSTPVTNHVYFGTTTVASNVLNIEVAELPLSPIINTPSPAFYHSGYDKILKFTFSPNDWGCLDTDHNNRHFEYQLINPNNEVISSGTIAKSATQWTYKMNPHMDRESQQWNRTENNELDGVYTFKLRESTVVGNSDWVSKTIEILPATQPSTAIFEADDILALSDWEYNLKITTGNNGSFSPVTTYKGTRLYSDPNFASGNNDCKVYNNTGNNAVTITRKAISGAPNTSGYGLEVTTTGAASPGLGGFYWGTSTSANKEMIIKIIANIPLGYKISWHSNYIGSKTPDSYGPESIALSSTTGNGHWKEYYFRVRCGGTDTPEQFYSTNYFALSKTDDVYPSEKIMDKKTTLPITWQIAYADCIEVNTTGSTSITVPQARVKADVLMVTENDDGKITKYTDLNRVEWDWTTYGSIGPINKHLKSQFNGYEDGLYRLRVQYERNYTTKIIRDEKIYEIIPPEVELYDESTITSCTASSDTIIYHLKLVSFAATKESDAWYSMDYGVTWTQLPQSSKNGAYRYYEKDLELSWLDYIIVRVHGKNPVNEKTETWDREMPSDYLVWLSWADRTENSMYRQPPLKISNTPTVGTYASQSGSTYSGKAEWKFGRYAYTASKTQSQSIKRGFYINGLHNYMDNGQSYRIEFKAKSSRARNIEITFEGGRKSKMISLTTDYQPFYIDFVYNSSMKYKSLTFYSLDWYAEEKMCVKEVKLSKNTVIRDNELLRRAFMSHNGGDIKKVRHIEKY